MRDQAGNWAYAGYKIFVIGGPGTSYKLNISDSYGNAGINIHAIDYVRPNQKIEISIT